MFIKLVTTTKTYQMGKCYLERSESIELESTRNSARTTSYIQITTIN